MSRDILYVCFPDGTRLNALASGDVAEPAQQPAGRRTQQSLRLPSTLDGSFRPHRRRRGLVASSDVAAARAS
jgi:hypothetical protein